MLLIGEESRSNASDDIGLPGDGVYTWAVAADMLTGLPMLGLDVDGLGVSADDVERETIELGASPRLGTTVPLLRLVVSGLC